jgi:hypothetical protein
MFWCKHHNQGAYYLSLLKIDIVSSTVFNVSFNVNFKIVFKTIHLSVSW